MKVEIYNVGHVIMFGFYKIEEENNEVLKLNEEVISKDIEIKAETKEEKSETLEKIKTKVNNEKKLKYRKNKKFHLHIKLQKIREVSFFLT